MNLNQVTLSVNHMAQACDFYRKLGFTQIVDTEHYARFSCPEGQSTFSLALANDTTAQKSGTTVYFEHQALDDWVDALQQKGIEFQQLPQDQSYLWREAILFDPSGNKLKLYWAGENRLSPPWKVNLAPL